jgi:hypothetical protein
MHTIVNISYRVFVTNRKKKRYYFKILQALIADWLLTITSFKLGDLYQFYDCSKGICYLSEKIQV